MRNSGAVSTVVFAACLDAGHVLHRNRIDQVDVAREQSRNARRIRADRLEHHLVEVVLDLPPPRRIGTEHRLYPWLVACDHERAGAVGLERKCAERPGSCWLRLGGAVGLRPCLGDDEPRLPFVVQDRIGRGEHEVDRVVVDLLDLGIGRNAGFQLRAGSARAFGGEHHVIGREGRPVVERHPPAQVEAPAGRVQHLPALGEAGDDLQVLVALDQAFHHVGEEPQRDRFVERVGVERVEPALERHLQRLGCGCRGTERGIARQACGKAGNNRKTRAKARRVVIGRRPRTTVCKTNYKLGKNW